MQTIKLIAITGGSGSGKSTASKKLQLLIGLQDCQILSQDNYYKDHSKQFKGDGSVNFDHPNAIDFNLMAEQLSLLKKGQSLSIPLYDFVTHTRKSETIVFSPTKFIVIDGTLILTHEPLRKLFDNILFIDIPEELRFSRRLKRDTQERGRTEEGVRIQFYNFVKPMHDKFIAPASQHAHYIARSDEEVEKRVKELSDILVNKDLV